MSAACRERLALVPAVLSFAAAALALATSLFGLCLDWPYAAETPSWRVQARGQDIGNLLAVIILSAGVVAARRGSMRGFQVWVGALGYLVYAFMIYAMTVHFSVLFLGYVAVLGLSLYSLAFALPEHPQQSLQPGVRRLGAGVLAGIAIAFAVLWLAAIVGALVSGRAPVELSESGLPANPVHVLDLAIVLPGMITAVRARRDDRAALMVAALLVFTALMAASIVATLLLSQASPVVVALFGTVTMASAMIATIMLRQSGEWSIATPRESAGLSLPLGTIDHATRGM